MAKRKRSSTVIGNLDSALYYLEKAIDVLEDEGNGDSKKLEKALKLVEDVYNKQEG